MQSEVAVQPSSDVLGHPKGLFILFLTEMWERFSYYGMRALLTLYLTKHMLFGDASPTFDNSSSPLFPDLRIGPHCVGRSDGRHKRGALSSDGRHTEGSFDEFQPNFWISAVLIYWEYHWFVGDANPRWRL